MKWMKDEELFADIDEKGNLISNEFTKSVLKGSAADEVKPRKGIDITDLGSDGIAQKLFESQLASLREYVQTHNHIGGFPPVDAEVSASKLTGFETRYEENPEYHEEDDPTLNPDYDPDRAARIEAARKRIVGIRAETELKITDWANAASEYDDNAYAKELSYREKLGKETDYWMEKLDEEARECETVVPKNKGVRVPVHRETIVKFRFLDHIGSFWTGEGQIEDQVSKEASGHAQTSYYIFRCVLWTFLTACVLLLGNLVWNVSNPVSELLGGFLTEDMWLAVLYAASSAIFLLLSIHSASEMPYPFFFYPFIAGAAYGKWTVLEQLDAETGELPGKIIIITTVITLFAVFILAKRMEETLAVMLVFLVYTLFGVGLSKDFIGKMPYSAIVFLCAGCIGFLANFVSLFLKRTSKGAYEEALLKAVNKGALTEYKMLRFLWLWINNAKIPDKTKYFEAVSQQESILKQRVAKAESYAKRHRLEFHPQ